MDSYEDRVRAVQLYINLGKRFGLTIRQRGYPTMNALKSSSGADARRKVASSGDRPLVH
jgi:hypothetical protein